jgi:hypothetical protein
MNLWLTIPVGERRQYLDDIIKESNIPGNELTSNSPKLMALADEDRTLHLSRVGRRQ